MQYSKEIEDLISAWMQREDMPAPVLVKRTPDANAKPLGRHDLAIVVAHERMGKKAIEGCYVLACDDDGKLMELAVEFDKLNAKLLRDSTADIWKPRNRLLDYFNSEN